MKIDSETLAVLKNFSNFNKSLYIEKGNVLRTVSQTSKALYAVATVPVHFELSFGIYELNRFLGAISLFKDPDFTFNKNFVRISDDSRSIDYYYADEKTLPEVKKGIPPNLPSDINFKLNFNRVSDLEKATAILGLPDIVIKGDGKKLYLQSEDVARKNNNVYKIELGDTNKVFNAIYPIDIFRMLPFDYEVSIAFDKLTYFRGKDIVYYVAMKYGSTYET